MDGPAVVWLVLFPVSEAVFVVRVPFLATLELKVGVGDGQRDTVQGDSSLPGQSHLHCPLAAGRDAVLFPTFPAEG